MINDKLQLTGVFVQDPASNGFTAFFAQFPNIIAEGDTEEEATQNLIETVKTVFEHQKNNNTGDRTNTQNVITKPFELAFA
jgi:predicted RNase H-like HicB family nuclease